MQHATVVWPLMHSLRLAFKKSLSAVDTAFDVTHATVITDALAPTQSASPDAIATPGLARRR